MTNQTTTTNVKVIMGSVGMKSLKSLVKAKKNKNIPILDFIKVEIIGADEIKAVHIDMSDNLHNVTTSKLEVINIDNRHNLKSFLFPIEAIKKVKGIKKDSVYSFEVVNDNQIIFGDNGINQVLSVDNSDNFLQYDVINENNSSSYGTIDLEDLLKLKSATLSVAKLETRPVLMNVCINNGVVCSTDSHRLYQTTLNDIKNEEMILLNKELIDKIYTLEGKNKGFHAKLIKNDQYTQLVTQYNTYTMKNPEGNYPDTSRLIPNDFNTVFTIQDVDYFKNVIEAASKISIDERNNIVRMKILNDNQIEISAKHENNSISQVIDVLSYGMEKGFTISFSGLYMLDGIKQLGKPNEIEFNIMGNMRPFIINDKNNSDTISLILPVRTY